MANNDSKNSTRIILPSIGGKDTDPHVTYEILQYSLNLFLRGRQNFSRSFYRWGSKIYESCYSAEKTSISIISQFPICILEYNWCMLSCPIDASPL